MLTREKIETAFKELGVAVATDGTHYVHSTKGRFAPKIEMIITLDEDGSGATIIGSLPEGVSPKDRSTTYELLNLIHGQSLWNVRFHLDEDGRILAVGKLSLWGLPFNPVALGDILFSNLVSLDRLYPCLAAVCKERKSAPDAFSRFFVNRETSDSSNA